MTDGQLPAIRLYKFISPGLLQTMGNQLVAGRDFTWAETYEKRPVVMISENLARELWRDPAAAIGKRVRENLKTPWHEIIGVVGDEHDNGLNQKAPSIVLWPILMENFAGDQTFARRTLSYMIRSTRTGSSGFAEGSSVQAVWSVDPNLPARQRSHTSGGLRRALLRARRSRSSCSAIAGSMALLLGSRVSSASFRPPFSQVHARSGYAWRSAPEARKSCGCSWDTASGSPVSAWPAAFSRPSRMTRLMSSLLFDVAPSDPLTLGAVSAGLIIAALSGQLPAGGSSHFGQPR